MAIKFLNTVAVDTDVLYVDASSNRVGIGTTSPAKKLDVNGSTNIDGTLFVNATNNHIRLIDSDGTGNFSVGVNNNFQIRDITANTTPLTIKAGTPGNTIVTTSSGNVGIGTGSPSELLHIHSGDSGGTANIAADEILVEGDGDTGITISSPSSNVGTLAFGDENVSLRGALRYDHSDDSMIFRVSSAEKMRITDTGNVGIGTTSPVKNLNLEWSSSSVDPQAGEGLIGGTSGKGVLLKNSNTTVGTFANLDFRANNVDARIAVTHNATNNGDFHFILDNTTSTPQTRLFIEGQTGNVGIGTTSPTEKLEVSGNILIDSIGQELQFSNHSVGAYRDGSNRLMISGYGGIRFQAEAVGGMENQATRMVINPSGNVGIGTTSPGDSLVVKGGSPGNIDLVSFQNNAGNETHRFYTDSANDGVIETVTNAGVTANLIQSSGNSYFNGGNVGIADTSPSFKLDVNVTSSRARFKANTGNADIELSSIDGHDWLMRSMSDDSFAIYDEDAATERIRIDSSGNVGIGTTNPSEKLEVAGNARITGDVTLSNGNALRWTSDDVRIEGTTAGDNIKFYVANTEILQLAQSGTLATVTGNLRVTGAYYDSSNSAGTSGQVLSSTATGTDWVSLSEISGVDGTGTANYVAKWSDADTITNSLIYDNGTNVGIGTTTTPNFLLDIEAPGADMRIFNVTSNANTDVYIRTTGTAASSRILFGDTADPDIGNIIYRHNSDSLAFTTNNSEAIRITSTGNVGIGTTSPTRKLTVNGSANVFDSLFVNSNTPTTDATTDAELVIQAKGNQAGTIRSSQWYFQTIPDSIYGNSAFRIAKNYDGGATSEFMRINSAGNVGIGTTSPEAKLDVESEILISGTDPILRMERGDGFNSDIIKVESSTDNIIIGDTSLDEMIFEVDTGEAMRINSSGYVSIGTTSPSTVGGIAKMTIDVGTSFNRPVSIINGTTDGMYIRRYSTGGSYQLQTTLSNANSGNLSLQSYGGNVGIGTTSPTQKLQVEGNIYTGGSIRIEDNGDQLEFGNANVALQRSANFLELGGYDGIIFRSSNATLDNQSERVRITSTGNVGIGTTSPSRKLQVQGTGNTALAITSPNTNYVQLALGDTDDDNYSQIILDNSTNKLQIQNGGGSIISNRGITLDSSENVGIGTDSPGAKLHVDSASDFNVALSKRASTTSAIKFTLSDPSVTTNTWKIEHDSSENLQIFGYSADSLLISTNSIERMRVASNGNVGIGTANPLNKLFVSANTASDYAAFIENTNSTNGYGLVARTAHTGTSSYAFAARAASSDIFVVRADGNVGIGTISPGVNFQVGDGTTDTTSRFYHNDNAYTEINGYGLYMSRNTSYIRPTIDNTKALYIGTDNKQWGTLSMDASTTTFNTNGSENMRIASNGNVGIGTTSPERQLSLYSNNTETTPRLLIEQEGTGDAVMAFSLTGGQGWSMGIDNSGGDSFMIHDSSGGVDSSSQFTIKTNGNVGIGTTNPQSKLHLATTGGSTLTIQNTTNSGNAALNFRDEGDNDQFQIYYALGANRSYNLVNGNGLTIYSSQTSTEIARFGNASSGYTDSYFTGNVGIGTTSPQVKLHINDSSSGEYLRAGTGGLRELRFSTYSTLSDHAGHKIDASSSNGEFAFAIGGDAKMYIKSSGDVGIDTDDPKSKLDVDGGVKIGDDTDAASADKVGTLRYRTSGNNSYVDMCMQTGATTYEWVNIVQNNW